MQSIAKFYDLNERPPRGGWIAQVDGREYQATGEAQLVEKVRQDWRNNGRTFTDFDISEAIWRFFRAREPERATVAVESLRARSAVGASAFDWKTSNGPAAWAYFHGHAASVVAAGVIDELTERRWLDGFKRGIGCEDCRLNWETELGKLPPDLSTPSNYFAWTVAIHNAVNSRLGKPQFSLDDATAIYLP